MPFSRPLPVLSANPLLNCSGVLKHPSKRLAGRGQGKGRTRAFTEEQSESQSRKPGGDALMRADPAGVLTLSPAQKVGRCRSGGQGPQGDPQRRVPHTWLWQRLGSALAVPSNLRWLFFQSDFVFNRRSALNTNCVHLHPVYQLGFGCQWRDSHSSRDAGGVITEWSAPSWPCWWQEQPLTAFQLGHCGSTGSLDL